MTTKLINFFKSNKHAIIWTIAYIAFSWAILYHMFNFDIFNGAQWNRLMRAQLRGFGGFVFGILILSAIPLYVATTTIIIRTKKPLITLPLPKIKFPKFGARAKTPVKEEKNDTQPTTEPSDQKETKADTIPKDIPMEMQAMFLRARNNLANKTLHINKIDNTIPPQNTNNITETNTPITNMSLEPINDFDTDTFPLPDDFDIDIPSDINTMELGPIPTFTEINFDSPTSEANTTFNNSEIKNHLTNNNIPYNEVDDIILTDKFAIITHNDTDFWVTDTDNWFAAGKTIPSPIKLVKQSAEKNNLTPMIYLAATNILDIENQITNWTSDGITVITDINEIK